MSKQEKHKRRVSIIRRIINALSMSYPMAVGSLAGYGVFYWYTQPFGPHLPTGMVLMLSMAVASMIGYVSGVSWQSKKQE